VHLTVVETRIGKVRVAGNTAHSEANIRRSLPAVAAGIIPNTDAISTDLRIANENPSKKVNLELQSSSQPGVIDALEQVTDQKTWSVGGVLDNSGYESSGRTHLTAQYQNFDLGGLDHTSARSTRPAPRAEQAAGVRSRIPHPSVRRRQLAGLLWNISTINSGTVAAGLLDLQVSGAGAVFGVHFITICRALGTTTRNWCWDSIARSSAMTSTFRASSWGAT